MTISFRALDIPASELAEKPLGQPSAEPLTGEILTRAQVFLDNETVTAGTWECEPGASRWEFTTRGEVIYVLNQGAYTLASSSNFNGFMQAECKYIIN